MADLYALAMLVALWGCLVLPGEAAGNGLEPLPPGNESGFSLPDLRDGMHTLADYRGKVVLVNFWASWCPPCIQEMPELVRLSRRLAERPFEILAVNVGEKKYQVRKFVRLVGFELPVLLDTAGRVSGDWGVETLPTSYLVDAAGRVRYRVYGSPGWDEAGVIDLLEALLSESDGETEADNENTNEKTGGPVSAGGGSGTGTRGGGG